MATDITDIKTGMPVCDAGGEQFGTIAEIWEPASGFGIVPEDPHLRPPTEGYIHVERGPDETDLYVPFHEIFRVGPDGVRMDFGLDHADEYIGKPDFLG